MHALNEDYSDLSGAKKRDVGQWWSAEEKGQERSNGSRLHLKCHDSIRGIRLRVREGQRRCRRLAGRNVLCSNFGFESQKQR